MDCKGPDRSRGPGVGILVVCPPEDLRGKGARRRTGEPVGQAQIPAQGLRRPINPGGNDEAVSVRKRTAAQVEVTNLGADDKVGTPRSARHSGTGVVSRRRPGDRPRPVGLGDVRQRTRA